MGPGPPGDGDEDWERVKSAYAELRVAQGLEAFAPNPKRGIGRDLRMMINQYSADEAVEVLLHCARSPLTAWVRGDNKTGKKYPPKTIYRQFEELRDEARSKPRPRPRAPPRADDWRAVGRAGPEVEDGWSEPGASDEELLGLGMERCKCEGRGCERCYSETRMKGWLTGSLGAR